MPRILHVLWPEKKGAPAYKFSLADRVCLGMGQLEAENTSGLDTAGLGTYEY